MPLTLLHKMVTRYLAYLCGRMVICHENACGCFFICTENVWMMACGCICICHENVWMVACGRIVICHENACECKNPSE